MNEKFLKPYDPKETEDAIYQKWLDSGFFDPDVCIEKGVCDKDSEKFSIALPPPNVTGILHMGHASLLTIEDIMVRFERMRGKKTLWLPGTDHAAIATQSKVEKELVKKEKKNRHDLGREKFLERVGQFAQESHDTIVSQIRKMGASVDWSREVFTLDEKRNFAVRTAFKQMYDDGLIYRDYRVVNWDPKGQTTISDEEIVYEERKANTYTFKYSKDFPISIATTRPETKVGDTAVAVHPDDKRYKKYIDKEYDVEFCDVSLHIKIIADKDVDPEYGTGAVGVTPAHSMIDFEMSERHNLPMVQVIDEYARMMVDTPELKGKKTKEAREIIVEWLEKEDLLEKTEEIDQNISTAERTGCVVEPLPKLQWFIDVNKKIKLERSKIDGVKSGESVTLKELMKKVIDTDQIQILPDRFEKIYLNWIDNLRPWCISRQIWYGHRIPVWYRTDKDGKEEIYCGIEAPKNKYNKVVLLHAWDSDPNAAFFPWLKQKFESRGIEVVAPALPNSKNPNFNNWLNEFEKIKTDEETIVIGRSLGATLALGASTRGKKMGKLISVCTPLDNLAISEFFEEMGELNYKKIKNNIKECSVIHSSDDPYIEKKISEKLSKDLGVKMTIVDNAGHFAGDKYNEILNACGLWQQDPDTLDTWFSSGLWTFSTLGWPEKTDDLKTYHPTNVLETGYDIIFFWVARMILMTTYLTGEIPFEYVYIQGLVRDGKGRKISKSLGNNVDPITLTEKYGTDALRMSLIVGVPPGSDNNMSEEKIRAYKKFANKMWNASRFVVSNIEDLDTSKKPKLAEKDEKVLHELDNLIKEITKDLEEFRLYAAADKLYHYFWHTFADIIIEESKSRLESDDKADKISCQWMLYTILTTTLKLLHPFMPFITEEIWSNIPKQRKDALLMVEKWPSLS